MPVLTISSFTSLVGLMLAARKLATDPDPLDRMKALADLAKDGRALAAVLRESALGPLAAEMERRARDADAAFAHDGPAREDARAVFWQVAPEALGDGAVLAGAALEAGAATEAMVAAIRGSAAGRDFARTALAEAYFRAVTRPVLEVMLARAEFVAGIAPDLWRESLRRQGIAIEMLERVAVTGARTEAKVDAQSELLRQMQAQLATMASAQEARASGVTDAALIGLARRIAADVADAETAFRELENAVGIAIRVQAEGRAGSNLGDFVDAVLRRVAERSAKGEHAAAVAEIEAALAQEEAESRARQVRLLDAALEQDLLRRDPEAAARRIVRKVELELPEGGRPFEALRVVFGEWYERGRDKGINLDLEVAIALARAQQLASSGSDERGTALMNLGNALWTLGAREAGTARLEEAVAAFRAALEERTRERVPMDWAVTQNNLGSALATLGEREAGVARLEQAVHAYRAALEEWTRERVPLDWAMTQNNLGAALWNIGAREAGTARLKEAVAAFRASLEERTRERAPLGWAATQNNLGNALTILGEREAGTAGLKEAVAAFRAALEERTRGRVPLDWAMTKNNLGNALWTLGAREAGTARLEEAVAAFREALEERTRELVPLDWAMTHNNLGTALATIGQREAGTVRLEEAVAAYRATLEEWTRERVPLDWAMTQMNLGNALVTFGERGAGTGRLEEAVAAYRAALEEGTRERVPLDWATTQMNLGNALRTLGERGAGTARLEEAAAAYRTALEEQTRDRVPLDWAGTTSMLGRAEALIAERTADYLLAAGALEELRAAELVLRDGGHIAWADKAAEFISAAEAILARLFR
jgi:tetratricopeptide (TPR) repeat protein